MPIYMKVEGVTGSGTGAYKGWIKLESAQLNPGRMVGSPAGKGTNREAAAPAVSEIVVTKLTDIASTSLFRLGLSGKGKKVVIHFVKSDTTGEAPTLALELENVLISNFSVSGHGGADSKAKAMESLSLNATKVTYSTKPVGPSRDPEDVRSRATWDLVTGGIRGS